MLSIHSTRKQLGDTGAEQTILKYLNQWRAYWLELASEKGERRGAFTTGIISYVKDKTIYLYLTGTKHAGENMSSLLSKRKSIKSKILSQHPHKKTIVKL